MNSLLLTEWQVSPFPTPTDLSRKENKGFSHAAYKAVDMEGMTWVSVESRDAKGLLPGYITVVVVSACAKSSGITEAARLAIPLPFCQVTIALQGDSCHNRAHPTPRRSTSSLSLSC